MVSIHDKKGETLPWHIIKDCLTYSNIEKDRKKYFKAKKLCLVLLKKRTTEEVEKLTEEEVNNILKKFLIINSSTLKLKELYSFFQLLTLGQCFIYQEIIDLFNNKDYSIDSLYDVGQDLIYDLAKSYKFVLSDEMADLVDMNFIIYCNLRDYFIKTPEKVQKVMEDYINLDEKHLKMLYFNNEEIKKRNIKIRNIKEGKNSIFCINKICNFVYSFLSGNDKKDEFKEVKIKNN